MISNVSSYGSVYENLYASKQTKTNETDEVSETETKTQVAKKSGKEEYLSELNKKYSSLNIMAGGVNTNCRSGNYPNKVDVMISPSVLEKMASDPKEAKKYEKMLADIPQCEKWANAMIKSMTGNEVKYRQVWIDENGNMGSFSISGPSEKQKQIDQKRRENEQEKFEERLEKAREKRKQLEEKTAEVNEKIAISEGTQDENNTAKDKAERLLLEKLENATHGEVYFDNEEMQMILNAAKEETQEQGDKVKNPVVAGNNFDMQI